MFVATKIPPKNLPLAGARRTYPAGDAYPRITSGSSLEKSLENMGLDVIDLQQFHVWNDSWALDESWQRAFDDQG